MDDLQNPFASQVEVEDKSMHSGKNSAKTENRPLLMGAGYGRDKKRQDRRQDMKK